MKNRRIELILEEVKDTDIVLDVGCTSHDHIETDVWMYELLCEKARRVVGVDKVLPNTVAEKYSRNLVIADAESMKLDETFDLIIAGELIEHLPNPGKFLERTREHLRDQGRLILTTPNPWDWTRLIRAVLKKPSTPVKEHLCWYDKETITNLVNRYGFKIEQIEFIPRLPYGGGAGFVATVVEKISSYISWLLYTVGLRQIAGMGLFIKCKIVIFEDTEKK